MASKQRGLTDIIRRGLVSLLCASVAGCSLPTGIQQSDKSANQIGSGRDLRSFPQLAQADTGVQSDTSAPTGQPATGQEQTIDNTIRMTADEVGHDANLGIFVARGHVEILSQGTVVKADVVTYNERTTRVTASGNVAVIQPNGDVEFATYADVTDDVKEGILYDFRMLMKDNSRLAANRAYRVEQDTKEILRKGVYTPCLPCAEDPSRAPLWQVKAYSAIRDKVNKTITYHDAWLEMFGVPVLYTPWFRHPDFGVDRQSGMLTPQFHYSSKNGLQIGTPYFQVLGPDKDITFTPIFTYGGEHWDRPGAVGMLEYRQRLFDGNFRIAGSGTIENRESDSSNNQHLLHDEPRGHIEGEGLFELDQNWRTGFDFKVTSDKEYLKRFHLGSRDILTDKAYVEGFFGRSYAQGRAYAFQTTKQNQQQDELPIIAPMLDYNFVGEPGVAGGYMGVNANFMNLQRVDGRSEVRLAANPYWTLPYTSSLGDIYRLTLEAPMTLHAVDDVDPNSDNRDPDESGDFDGTVVRAIPKATFDWRFPFVRPNPTFTQVIEPMFQLVGAPDTGNTGKIPNEDSRTFELDDTSVFLGDRFPGWDRMDAGSRATYGTQWSAYMAEGGYVNAFLGQSFQFTHHDNDEFRSGTGITNDLTDAVGRLQFRPTPDIDLSYRFRFDVYDEKFERHEARASYVNPGYVLAASYAFIAADSEFQDREQVSGYAKVNLTDYWSIDARSSYDLADSNLLRVGGGFRYLDECFDMSLEAEYVPSGETEETQGEVNVLLTVTFKNLGGLDIPY